VWPLRSPPRLFVLADRRCRGRIGTSARWAIGGQPRQFIKARLFGDEETAGQILAAAHPGKAKALGRQVYRFDEQRWAAERFDLVVTGNLAKFGQHQDLREFLLGTGKRVLVEASPLDRVWGTGLAADDQHATSPAHWPGLNLLGFALMEVRHQLTIQSAKAS